MLVLLPVFGKNSFAVSTAYVPPDSETGSLTHTLSFPVEVSPSYECRVEFLAEFEYRGGSAPTKILRILNAKIITENSHSSVQKYFVGRLYYNLESGNRLYWNINGDFYENDVLCTIVQSTDYITGNISYEASEQIKPKHFKYIFKQYTYSSPVFEK